MKRGGKFQDESVNRKILVISRANMKIPWEEWIGMQKAALD
jgi:hypothetical protein